MTIVDGLAQISDSWLPFSWGTSIWNSVTPWNFVRLSVTVFIATMCMFYSLRYYAGDVTLLPFWYFPVVWLEPSILRLMSGFRPLPFVILTSSTRNSVENWLVTSNNFLKMIVWKFHSHLLSSSVVPITFARALLVSLRPAIVSVPLHLHLYRLSSTSFLWTLCLFPSVISLKMSLTTVVSASLLRRTHLKINSAYIYPNVIDVIDIAVVCDFEITSE